MTKQPGTKRFRALMVAVVSSAVAFVTPAVASAHPCHRTELETEHCYSIASWYMPSSGEEVRGAYAELETYYGEVPHFNEEFLTNELWVDFPSKSEAWVEAGIVFDGGRPGSPTNDEYFYARSYGPKQFMKYQNYDAGAPMYSWYGVYIDDPSLNGDWCITWKWDSKPDECFPSFPKTSKLLQTGLEDAGPSTRNNGRSVGWKQTMSGGWYKEWNDAGSEAEPFHESPTCINAPAPGYPVGSIAFSVPGC